MHRALPLTIVLGLAACYEGSGTTGTTTSDDASGTTEVASDGASTTATDPSGTDSDPDGTTTMTDPDSTGDESTGEPLPPGEPAIHWVGRWNDADPSARRMGWSGGGMVVRFDGTGLTASMDDPARYHTLVIDGVVQPPLATSPGQQDYVLAAGLPAGEHTVELYRRTEGNFGATVVHGVTIDGELLAPPPVMRRMEVIGDSITAGYGNEGAAPCNFSPETENHYQTYAAIAARAVGAELHAVAWSGKGVIYNYGDDVTEPLPEIYDRTIATEQEAWGFGWQPDVVVINLGTNDFSTDNDPSQALFVDSYVAFTAHLRDVYPGAFILMVAPSLFGAELPMVEGYLADVVAQRQAAGDPSIAWANVNVPWEGSGCDGHPNVVTHEGMAGRLVEELALHLGW